MSFCQNCGKSALEGYKYCKPCNDEYKKKNQTNEGQTVDAIQKLNNNLYAIRTVLEEILWNDHGGKLVWHKGDGTAAPRFVIEYDADTSRRK